MSYSWRYPSSSTSASLIAANFEGAELADADFKDADLREALIMGVDLSHVRGLTQDQLDEACGDSRTKTPSGLTAKSCHGHFSPHISISIPGPPNPPAPPHPPRYLVQADKTP